MKLTERHMWLVAIVAIVLLAFAHRAAPAFGPVPKKDQCISVNAMLQRNCAPVYMCNGTPDTNASWCCSARWSDEEAKLVRWHKRHCRGGV
jgi:hypothetical protein